MNIEFQPFISWPLIWVFAALAFAALAIMLQKRIRGAALRAVSALLVLTSLTNPTLRQDQREPLTDIVIAIVDQSQSQSIGNRTQQTEKALAVLKTRIAALGNTELRVINVTSGINVNDDGTRLFAALNRNLADIPKDRFAGAFLITDGQVHDIPSKFNQLSGPIHALLTGHKSESDRRIIIDKSPKFGIVGKDQTIQFHVEDSNASTEYVSVTLKIPGEAPTIIDVQIGQLNDVKIPLRHAGQNLAEISAPLREGELSAQNNQTTIAIEGIRDRLRVLLVSGQPHAGERTWRNLLKADASVDLVHFTILRPPEKQDGTPTKELSLIAFPTRELFIDKLDQFDLVIFDRYRRQAILPDSYLGNIADYVRKGGALLVASGPDYAEEDGLYSTPLADVLSASPTGTVIETPFKPNLTTTGLRHPVTQNLPGANGNTPSWGRWFRLIDTIVGPEAETVMAGPEGKPLLVLNHVGEGRVAQLLSDHGWLWSRGYEGGGPQTELLRRIAHWLMKEPDLEEEALTAKQASTDILIQRKTLGDTAKPVTITSPSGKTETVELKSSSQGVFAGHIKAKEAGLYNVSDEKLQAAAAIGNADTKESLDIRATSEKLAPIISASGGGISWLEDGMPIISATAPGKIYAGAGWQSVRANGVYRVTAIHEIELFSSLLSLAMLLATASAMWWREGR
jgi:hypothetical protein